MGSVLLKQGNEAGIPNKDTELNTRVKLKDSVIAQSLHQLPVCLWVRVADESKVKVTMILPVSYK